MTLGSNTWPRIDRPVDITTAAGCTFAKTNAKLIVVSYRSIDEIDLCSTTAVYCCVCFATFHDIDQHNMLKTPKLDDNDINY